MPFDSSLADVPVSIALASPLRPTLLTLEISGMKCAGCVSAVEKRLLQQSGVERATVNLVTTVALVEYWPAQTNPDQLAASLSEVGFSAQRRDTPQGDEASSRSPGQQNSPLADRWRSLAIAALLILLSSLGHLQPWLGVEIPFLDPIWLHWALATGTLILCRAIFQNGWQGLRHGMPNMNTLVGIGALSAYGASLVALLVPGLGWECFFDEPVMLLGFILLGRTLEAQARHRAGQALRGLLSLQPEQAQVLVVGEDALAPLHQPVVAIAAGRLKVGERVRVLPGERIPADGQVIAGQSSVDESMLTGEFEPVAKTQGETVSAGSLNLSAPLVLAVTQSGSETTLARMIDLVEMAQARKAPIQKLVDQVAGYFAYGVITMAVLTFGFWYFLGVHLWPQVLAQGSGWMMGMGHGAMHGMAVGATTPLLLSLKLAIAVLVVACPCSLGLATPTAMLVGSSLGAERGLLIRGGDVLEQVHRIDTVVFDKTGTLTTGKPTVSEIRAWTPVPSTQILQWAASLEAGTRHPIALAILEAAQSEGLSLLPVDQNQTQAGLGVVGQVQGQRLVLGNRACLLAQGISLTPELDTQADTLAATGKTVVYLAQLDASSSASGPVSGPVGRVLGFIALSDTLRPEAALALDQLRARGLSLRLLTGDRPTTALALAPALSLTPDQVWANVQPEGKVKAIAQLQAAGHQVAMVGDGINDGPALAQADVGIALGSGTEVAIETAQIVLLGDRLTDVIAALDLSEATLRKIKQNLGWAFGYNLIAIPLAAGLLLPSQGIAVSPAVAGACMALSSVLVVTNSLLLRWSTQHPERT